MSKFNNTFKYSKGKFVSLSKAPVNDDAFRGGKFYIAEDYGFRVFTSQKQAQDYLVLACGMSDDGAESFLFALKKEENVRLHNVTARFVAENLCEEGA